MWLYIVYASNSKASYADIPSAAIIFAVCLVTLTAIVLGRRIFR